MGQTICPQRLPRSRSWAASVLVVGWKRRLCSKFSVLILWGPGLQCMGLSREGSEQSTILEPSAILCETTNKNGCLLRYKIVCGIKAAILLYRTRCFLLLLTSAGHQRCYKMPFSRTYFHPNVSLGLFCSLFDVKPFPELYKTRNEGVEGQHQGFSKWRPFCLLMDGSRFTYIEFIQE